MSEPIQNKTSDAVQQLKGLKPLLYVDFDLPETDMFVACHCGSLIANSANLYII